MQELKIFLASSSELKEDRTEFELFIGRRNKVLVQQGIFLNLVIWEDFLDALAADGLQKEYNKAIQACDVFVMLYFTKVGKYTAEEFETAIGAFHEGGKPMIFTYFKDAALSVGSVRREDMQSLWAFQDKLKALGHYQTVYKSTEDLLLKFGGQLERVLSGRASSSGSASVSEEKNSIAGNSSVNPPPPTAPEKSSPKNYNLGNIIKLLTNAFDSSTAFEAFALIHFEDVHRQFTGGMAQQARILQLVTYAKSRGKLDVLLEAVKAENDYQYYQWGPYYA
jgi:hypothetical protein